MVAYASDSGTSTAHTVAPAIRSLRAQDRRYPRNDGAIPLVMGSGSSRVCELVGGRRVVHPRGTHLAPTG